MKRIILGENAEVLPTLPAKFARLIYIDPPFNTGKVQKRDRIRATATGGEGDRSGFGGRRYDVERIESSSYDDDFDDFQAFLMPRIEAGLRCATPDGSLFVHLDSREVHHVKVALDALLGRKRFMNEIIWAYDYGGRPKNRWPAKHDTILWYALDPDAYVFNFDAMDRIPYMAPGLVSPEKALRGKTPTDVWWQTIVPTSGREKTGYPTQKPIALLNRIVKVHSQPGDVVLDFFAGSGTTGDAAARHGRGFVLVDCNAEAVRICAERLAEHHPACEGFAAADGAVNAATNPLVETGDSSLSAKKLLTHVALLRGINVGGKNKLPMKDLVTIFVAAGCVDVQTYIQSGNVVCKAPTKLTKELPPAIAGAIFQRWGHPFSIVMRTADELDDVGRNNPFLKAGREPDTLHVAFLADVPEPARVSVLDPKRSPPDELVVRGRDIYLRLPNGVASSKLTNAYFDAALRTTSTLRNWRTVLQLIEMARS